MGKKFESLEDFNKEAVDFARGLQPRAEGATLVTLSGALGAGKTAFVKAAARALGIAEVVNSPTFVLEKIYSLDSTRDESADGFARLVHIDAYRLESGAELAPLGFGELMKSPQNIIFLEWPEQVATALPPAAVSIFIASEDGARKISYA